MVKKVLLVRSYLLCKPDFVSAGEKTFGDLVTEKMAAYGDEWKNVNFADGQDGLFNADKAKAEFAKAKTALEAEGVKFPIHLDVPVDQTSKNFIARIQSFKQSVEKVLGEANVVVDIQQISKDNSLMRLIMLLMRRLRIGIFQVLLDGILTMKIHQLTLIS